MPALPPDYHSHTELCHHATGKPIDYLRAAQARGLPALASTDHTPVPGDDYSPNIRMACSDFSQYWAWVDEARYANEGTLLFGIEADYFEGCEDTLGVWLRAQPFDLVLGSVHFLDYYAVDRPSERSLFDCDNAIWVWKRYFELVAKMAESHLYDIVAHLDLPKRFGTNRIPLEWLREFALPALDAIALAGMAIEINTSGLRHECHEFYPSQPLLRWANERGIPITFGSDAHSPDRVGAEFECAMQWARDAGYDRSVHLQKRQATLVEF